MLPMNISMKISIKSVHVCKCPKTNAPSLINRDRYSFKNIVYGNLHKK